MSKIILLCILAQFGVKKPRAREITKHVLFYSHQHKIDPLFIIAVAYHESLLKKKVKSKKGTDHGLMQIYCPSKDFAWWCKHPQKLMTIKRNIRIGTLLMARARRIHTERCPVNSKHHWIRHYNWYSKRYDRSVMADYALIIRKAGDCIKMPVDQECQTDILDGYCRDNLCPTISLKKFLVSHFPILEMFSGLGIFVARGPVRAFSSQSSCVTLIEDHLSKSKNVANAERCLWIKELDENLQGNGVSNEN